MKCPKCAGNAELSNWGSWTDPDYADYHVECEKCGYYSMGSTDPQKAKEMFKKEMGMYYTNEQWLRLATTEQLAEWINNIVDDGIIKAWMIKNNCCGDYLESVKWWLKQPHTFK